MAKLLGAPASWFLSLLIAAMLATWLPNYLLWPWWPDLDAWATIAQGWDAGLKPYRDVAVFNFPGPIEQAYVLGKLCGWGRTVPVYAVDAGLLLGLGVGLWWWSRTVFGRALPGLLGFAAAVWYDACQDYTLVAQRDWQGPLLAIAALLLLQAGRGGGSLAMAALLAACGFVNRPHVVLFGPALAWAIWERRSEGEPIRRFARRLAAFCVMGLTFAALLLSPLIAQGLMGDLARGVRRASYGSGYNQTTPGTVATGVFRGVGLDHLERLNPRRAEFWGEVGKRLDGWKALAILIGLAFVSTISDVKTRRIVAPWAMLMVLALFYEPLHPKRHHYLALPIHLVMACASAPLLAGILRGTASRPVWGAIGFAVLLAVSMPGAPRFCSLAETRRSFQDWQRSGESEQAPDAAVGHFRPIGEGFPGDWRSLYLWDDYRRTLMYLRRHTSPETSVANLLRGLPFPSINGPIGRVSPLPAESGVIWLWSVDPGADATFRDHLEREPIGSVVVWAPDEPAFHPNLKMEASRASVAKHYRAEARFGKIEVWRKVIRADHASASEG